MGTNKWLMFAAGLLVGLVVALWWPFGHAVPSAAAEGGKADSPRFQISAWAHAGTANNNGLVSNPSSGVYVVDTQNGNVWQIILDGTKTLGKGTVTGRARGRAFLV
jgi:hypothetical protein